MLPQVFVVELELSLHLVVEYVIRDADPARLGEPFQARGDVHAVAVEAISLDPHVAQVDADPELHLPPVGDRGVAGLDDALDLGCALHGVECGRELGQEVVAREIHEPAPVLHDESADLLPVRRHPVRPWPPRPRP